MIATIVNYLRQGWKSLAVTDALFKLLALIVLVPAVGLLFQLFLSASGRDVLADVEIARFLLHPIGWIALIVVGAATISLFAIEIAVLLTVCIGVEADRIPKPRSAILFVAERASGILRVAVRIVIRCAAIALPFLAVGGGIFWWLLTEHDINFYLSNRPPEFLSAVLVIGLILVAMLGLLFYRVFGWVYAAPLVLFEGMNAKDAMAESDLRVRQHQKEVFTTVAAWAAFSLALRFVVSFLVVWGSQSLLWLAGERLALLVITLGLLFLVVSCVNLIVGILVNSTLASCITMLYVRSCRDEKIVVPEWKMAGAQGIGHHFTRGRVISAAIIMPLVSGLLGITILSGLNFDDQVQITAHRGGAYKAPENTIAAIEQGIADGADWIEIDVQESLDGVVMVIHDSDLMKVAGVPTKVWNANAEELRSIDIGSFFDAQFSDQRMSTLEEVLRVCRGKAGVNIELKYYGHDQDLERKVVEIVERNEMASEIVIMSLEASGIAKMKQLRPDWTVGLLTAVVAGDLSDAKADFLAVKDSIATTAFVQSAHRRGKTVSAWTLNDAHSLSLMISRGVDNLITDRPALAHQVLAQRNALSPVERLTLEVAYYLGIKPKLEQLPLNSVKHQEVAK